MPFMVVTRNHVFEKEWQFDGLDVLTIGRASTNDIVLADESAKVSRYHACVVRCEGADDRYFLRDLGSLHLTKVGGAPITQHSLGNGDVIEIGPYQLIYTEGTSRRPTAVDEEDDLLAIIDIDHREGSSSAFRRAQGQTTKPVIASRLFEGVALTNHQQEMVTEYLRKAQTATDLPSFFSTVMEAVAKVFDAASGFAGLFANGTAKGYRPLGVHGLDPKKGERLHITSKTYLDDLRKGSPVVEPKVMLVPMYSQDRVAGFLCLGWKTRSTPISKAEVDALCLLGRLTTVVGTHNRQGAQTAKESPAPTPAWSWPATLIGRSALAQTLRTELLTSARTDDNVLLYGPTGAGKEVAATTIHRHSAYSRGPFLAISCSTLQETLAESELFGYAPKSGIAGADPNGKPGLFELASGGVLFLDEIHTLSLALQAKLLRVLAEKEVWRLGSRLPVHVNVKVVAATNEDLPRSMDKGTFRNDLYFRFGWRVRIPALAERTEDVPLLIYYFLDRFANQSNRPPFSVSRQALQRLSGYGWPGNIRELRDWVKQAVSLKREVWFSWDLPKELYGAPVLSGNQAERPKSMKDVEKAHILEALAFTRGNKSEATRVLGFNSRQTLLNKMDEYQIAREYGGASEGEEANAGPGNRESIGDGAG
jgi:DNA-binding NtrC family response regulator